MIATLKRREALTLLGGVAAAADGGRHATIYRRRRPSLRALTVQSADQGTAKRALNNAVILQFLEQGFHGGLCHHDRWDGKYHAP